MIIILVSLLLAAFFAGVETAFLSSSRLKIEMKSLQGNRAAQILSNFKRQESKVLITILIASNIILVVCTGELDKLSEPVLKQFPALGSFGITLLQTIFTTVIVLVFAEYIPKAIFRRLSDRIIFPSAFVLQVFYSLMAPLTWVVNLITKLMLMLLKAPSDDEVVMLGKKDLEHYIEELTAVPEVAAEAGVDAEMLQNALEFRETRAREFMIPRTQIVAVEVASSPDEVMALFEETKLSRILIYRESLDQVIGFVHSNDFFRRPATLAEIRKPVLPIPESMKADMLLREFGEKHRTVAVVIDEFGGTSGMITMEDLIEEVFGDIEDEHDDAPSAITTEEDMQLLANPDGSYILGARLEIYDLNDQLPFSLPEDDAYTTLGGLVVYFAERIPAIGEVIEMGEFRVEVLNATETRVVLVRLSRSEAVA